MRLDLMQGFLWFMSAYRINIECSKQLMFYPINLSFINFVENTFDLNTISLEQS